MKGSLRNVGLIDSTSFGAILNVSWEYWGLLGRACLMEGVYCSLIICCPASGNKAAEIFPTGGKGGETNGLMVRISVMLSVWPYSGGNSAVAR